MAQAHRVRLVRPQKQEQEIHIVASPFDKDDPDESSRSFLRLTPLQKEAELLTGDDYQAPLTSFSLQPNSHWLTVRRNLHRIRCMGFSTLNKDNQLPDLYLGFQMIRELRRAKEEIQNIDKQKGFHTVKQFSLAGEDGNRMVFKTGHVTSDDALIYDRLGEEPLPLQNLLYYFSKLDVEHGTIFWDFLNEVNRVLNLKRKRTALVKRLQRIALTLSIILYTFMGLMFFMMIISVISTATKSNDPEVLWMDRNSETYPMNIRSPK